MDANPLEGTGPRLAQFGDGSIWVPITCSPEEPGADYETSMTFDVIDGRLQCREVRVTARTNGPEVTRVALRGLSIEDLRDRVASTMTLSSTAEGGRLRFSWPAADDDAGRAANLANLRASQRRKDPVTLERVAEVYRANEDAPTKAVQEAFGVAHRTASLYVQRAREGGFLEPYRNEGGRAGNRSGGVK